MAAVGQLDSVAAIERGLAGLRDDAGAGELPYLRTSVMTHIGWAPEEWLDAARATLAGLGERHPSRTILLVPEPEAGVDELEAAVSLECFPLETAGRCVCSEVIELHLRGARARAPGSVVVPLLVSGLPVFLRWRGRPPFGSPELEQLVDVADRLVLDSEEWPDPEQALRRLPAYFEGAACSDIAWARMLEWRHALAALWPDVAEIRGLRVVGPRPAALLLAGWLRARLRGEVELAHEQAQGLETVEVDGELVARPRDDGKSPSDLLSDELEVFGRDPVYEEAVRAAV